jgi:1-acyl-sn-glycerol-3-phosphate acyltransferase
MIDWTYDAAKLSLGVIFKLWRMRVFGAGNVPAAGPVIVACNHVSYFDPPLLGTACPRRIRYMAKAELFRMPGLGPAITAFGAYPVDREGTPMAAVRRSVEVLRRGDVIGIFPEGRRNLDGSVQPHEGVALLASLGKSPVVPAAVAGTGEASRLKRFEVFFGPPLSLPADRKATREDLANFTAQVMQSIRKLPESIRGD